MEIAPRKHIVITYPTLSYTKLPYPTISFPSLPYPTRSALYTARLGNTGTRAPRGGAVGAAATRHLLRGHRSRLFGALG